MQLDASGVDLSVPLPLFSSVIRIASVDRETICHCNWRIHVSQLSTRPNI